MSATIPAIWAGTPALNTGVPVFGIASDTTPASRVETVIPPPIFPQPTVWDRIVEGLGAGILEGFGIVLFILFALGVAFAAGLIVEAVKAVIWR